MPLDEMQLVAPANHAGTLQKKAIAQSSPARPDWPVSTVLLIGFLPWLAAALITSGLAAALNLTGYALVVTASGYCILRASLSARPRSVLIFLAPAAGILVLSSITAFWVRLGLPLIGTMTLWSAFFALGAWMLFRDRREWTRSTIAYGRTLMLLSALICDAYFVPQAANDMVQHSHGSFTWWYKDSQHFHAIAASIKNGSPPKTPGTATADLLYHFAPYAPAAAISRFDGLALSDALVRVTRGASLWALVLSCFGVGALLSIRATGETFGGVMSVAGMFFYGSLLSLFAGELNSAGHWFGGMLFTIPDIFVYGEGGPFIYLLAGHSLLHGLVAITAVMGLCLAAREGDPPFTLRNALLLLLPALVIPMNSVAGLYCAGIVPVLLFWGRLRSIRSWIFSALLLCLFLGAWKVMGFSHAPDAARAALNAHPARQWWTLVVAFVIGLGFRIVGFRWIVRLRKDPIAAMVLLSTIGLLSFFLLLQLHDGNERYGVHFLQCLFSIFAFSRVRFGCWRSAVRTQIIAGWLRTARTGVLVLAAAGILIGGYALAAHHPTAIPNFGRKLGVTLLFLALLAGIAILMQRNYRFARFASAIVLGALAFGFLGWTPDWLRYGLGRIKTDVTYAPGEVHGLQHLGQLMAPGERFATNRHALHADHVQPILERSYGYSALSERPVLLEGYMDRGEDQLPGFATLLHDNDLLFTTTDPKQLRNTAQKWQVRWLVARPGTDIALPRPLPPWLVQQQDAGDLKIYRID